jgi:AraC-like DNA-binding protein
MTEHESHDLCEMLRGHLGVRFQGTLEEGRDEIIRLIASDLGVSRDEAQAIFKRELDAGRIRYITADERDHEAARIAADEHGDHGRHSDLDDHARNLTINAIPGQGGVSAGTAGLSAGAAAPVITGGTSTPAIPPIMPAGAAHPIDDATDTDYFEGGYWDLCGDRAGVVPSRSRKGQVEPRGT